MSPKKDQGPHYGRLLVRGASLRQRGRFPAAMLIGWLSIVILKKKGVRVLDMHVNENVQHLPTKKERDDDS